VASSTTLKRTPFFDFHRAAGAKLVEFAGYEMPVRYTGDVREHLCVRNAAGLFDVSHMGEFVVRGEGAADWLDRMVTNEVSAIAVGQALYTPMCRPDGGIVDDLLIYRSADRFMLVVNAANIAKDFAWLDSHRPAGVTLEDVSEATALLALQGPKAPAVLAGHVPDAVLDLGYYRFTHAPLFGVDALIARTGYTGEDGFELYFAPEGAARVWEGLMAAGKPHGLEPVGLGARDTLRLELALMLYGNDIDDTTSPIEAGLGWTVKFKKPEFHGREVLARQKAEGTARKLVGFEVEGRRVPRHDMALEREATAIGRVTSGSFAPSLERPIGLGYVESGSAALDSTFDVRSGETRLAARVVRRPFYARGSRRT